MIDRKKTDRQFSDEIDLFMFCCSVIILCFGFVKNVLDCRAMLKYHYALTSVCIHSLQS